MASRVLQVAADITAVGSVTPWLKLDPYQTPFNVALAVYFDTALAATLKVQYVADDQSQTSERDVLVSQAASVTATIKDSGSEVLVGAPFGHGLLVNDVVFLMGTQAGIDNPLIGYPVATVVDQNTYTVTTPVNQTITNVPARVKSARVFDHQVLQGLTARAQSNLAYGTWMVRIICTAFTAPGVAYLVALQGK